MTQEVGASNWLTTLPIKAKGFSLNKQEFTDALAIRYGWSMDGLPQHCTCGSPSDSNHAMICNMGGFMVIRHDEVRDLTAQMLREVCHDVRVEPDLLPTGGRNLDHRTVNTADDARVDISARGFWARGQRAFFDVRVFNPMAPSNRGLDLRAVHLRHENAKVREYRERIQEVDHGSFTPLVFTTTGGMAPRAATFYGILAQQLAEISKEQCHRMEEMPPFLLPLEVIHPVPSRDAVQATTLRQRQGHGLRRVTNQECRIGEIQ